MKKIIMAACLSVAMLATQARADQDTQALVVPTATGIVSGYIYGSFIKEGNWLAYLISNILIGRCKDRIYRHFDKEARQSATRNVEQLAAMLSLFSESKKDNDGIVRSTYVIHADDRNDTLPNRYAEMSDLDDLVTMLTVLLTLAY